ncbi:hypothetical protein ACE6H2_025586 [Prunus campanulata]
MNLCLVVVESMEEMTCPILGCMIWSPIIKNEKVTNPLGAINWVHVYPYITPGVTNPMWAINWIHVDPNITLRLPIFLGQSIGSMPIPTSPESYQSPWGNQLDPCQSQYHHEVTNPLGEINQVPVDPYITLGVTNPLRAINWIHADPNITLRTINWIHVDPYITTGVTNSLGAINWIHADPNITMRLPILWGDQLGPCRSVHYPGGYQSPRFNQLDPCRSLYYPKGYQSPRLRLQLPAQD